MSTLGEEFLRAGLINKKQHRKANQEAKIERKQKQGRRKKNKVVNEERRQQRRESKQQEKEQLRLERAEREQHVIAQLKEQQVGQLLSYHQIRIRGGDIPFWHLTADGQHAHRIYLTAQLQRDLDLGRCGIAVQGDLSAEGSAEQLSYLLIPKDIVERIQGIDASRILLYRNPEASPDEPE
jgi:uncharacterized protein